MKNYVIAHDLGTTGNKATLYDPEGLLVGSAFYGYQTVYPHDGWAEQNPDDWWQAVCASTRQLLRETGVPGNDIASISFSGQMMGCVPIDEDGRPLRSAIIWADQRALEQTKGLAVRVDRDEIYRITGHRLSPAYTLPKILWLRDNQAEIFHDAHKFLHPKEAIIARLTGTFVTEPSDASGTNLYDLEASHWSEHLMQAAQLNPEKLPELHHSTDVVGVVQSTVVDDLGLVAGTPVVIGGGDGACATAGAGALRPGIGYCYIGSSAWIATASQQPLYDPDKRTFTFGHVIPNSFIPMGTMQAAGAAYQWIRDQLGVLEEHSAEANDLGDYELLNIEAQKIQPGANGLIFLPYLMGERSPRWNPQARGAFIGLTVRHTRAHMIRAVLEGVAMNLRVILDAFRAQGAQFETMRLIGGGARGRVWNQIMADIFDLPVQRLAFLEEASSMGAALVGGVGIGLYPDFSLIETMNPVVETIDPIPENQRRYDEIFPIFEAAYTALVPVYELIAATT